MDPHPLAGTPELAQHGGGDNGLTGFSLDLDEFERPPELQGEPAQLEQQEQQAQQQEQMELDAALGEAAAEEEAAAEAAAQALHAQQADDFASPALQAAGGEFGTGAWLLQ